VYQGRFKAVPIQHGSSLIRVCRYVERNALRKGLVDRAENWEWSSLFSVRNNRDLIPLAEWPIPRPDNWLEIVNSDEIPSEVDDLRKCIRAISRSAILNGKRQLPFAGPRCAERSATRPIRNVQL
jgi:putative transposase